MNISTLEKHPFKVGDTYTANGVSRKIIDIKEYPSGSVLITGHRYCTFEEGEFELMILQQSKKEKKWPSGQVTPAGTYSLPSSSTWGDQGWTYTTRKSVERKIVELEQANKL